MVYLLFTSLLVLAKSLLLGTDADILGQETRMHTLFNIVQYLFTVIKVIYQKNEAPRV